MPYNLNFHVLCPSDVSIEGSCSFGLLRLKTQGAVYANPAMLCVTDDSWYIECGAFIVPATANGSIEVSGTINCNTFLVEANANISCDFDTVVWRTSCNIETVGAFNYVKITPWEYEALLNQVDTDPPTAVVLKNSLGETLTYGYVPPGEYFIKSPGSKFVLNNTAVYFGAGRFDGGGLTTLGTTAALAVDEINFAVYSPFGFAFANDQLVNTPINIKVYPAKY